jgi:ubiquinone/menaquinone biosynthesis C-methylase UbiE
MRIRLCPFLLGYFLLCPVRKLRHDPDQILSTYIKPGMKVVDFGSAMGYFSLPMARMVSSTGKVYCLDIQEKMLSKLKSRAKNAGYAEIIETRLITEKGDIYSDLEGTVDFVLLCAVAHEVPDRVALFSNLCRLLKNKGQLLFIEPAGHVSEKNFAESVSLAEKAGFSKLNSLKIKKSHGAIFQKNIEI